MAFRHFKDRAEAARPPKPTNSSVSVCVTCGRRSRNCYRDSGKEGVPILKEYLFVMEYKPSDEVSLGGRPVLARRAHPDYSRFYNVDKDERVFAPIPFERLAFTLVHKNLEDAIDVGLRAQSGSRELKGLSLLHTDVPGGGAWCSSNDGVTAQRWNGTAYATIRCPNEDACPIYAARACRATTHAVFQLDAIRDPNDDTKVIVPARLAYTASKSAEVKDVWMKFVRTLEDAFAALGIEPDARGVRGEMFVRMKQGKQNGQTTRYPVLQVTQLGDLESTLFDAARRRAEIQRLFPVARALAEESRQVDDLELSGEQLRPLVVARPSSVEETRGTREAEQSSTLSPSPLPSSAQPSAEHPPIMLIEGVSVSPDGSPTCPVCDAMMVALKGKTGAWGWVCSTRASARCNGARKWSGEVVGGR